VVLSCGIQAWHLGRCLEVVLTFRHLSLALQQYSCAIMGSDGKLLSSPVPHSWKWLKQVVVLYGTVKVFLIWLFMETLCPANFKKTVLSLLWYSFVMPLIICKLQLRVICVEHISYGATSWLHFLNLWFYSFWITKIHSSYAWNLESSCRRKSQEREPLPTCSGQCFLGFHIISADGIYLGINNLTLKHM